MTTQKHAEAPLFPNGLIFLETPANGLNTVWYAQDFNDAVVVCIKMSIHAGKGDQAAELEAVETLDQLKKIIGADLRSIEAYTWGDFKNYDLDSFDAPVIDAAQSLGWVIDAEDAGE